MRIGIDLGGTKIEGIALDDSGKEILRQRIDTPQGNYQATIAAIVNLIQLLEVNTTNRHGRYWHSRGYLPDDPTCEKCQFHLADWQTTACRSSTSPVTPGAYRQRCKLLCCLRS